MIVVTGGAGFIGTNLVRSLLESDKKVLVVEELDKYTKKFENINFSIIEKTELSICLYEHNNSALKSGKINVL